jgi:hypothetical protein
MKASMGCLSYLTEVKEAPCIDFVSKIENQIFTWLSQETPRRREVEDTGSDDVSQRSFAGLGVLRLSRTTCMAVSGYL